jgi:hypothetical protein
MQDLVALPIGRLYSILEAKEEYGLLPVMARTVRQ